LIGDDRLHIELRIGLGRIGRRIGRERIERNDKRERERCG